METIRPGERLGHYHVVSRIGAGGMGEVFRAEDLKLQRTVAIKLLPPTTSADPAAVERLLREARAASSLNHPAIVTIYAIEESDAGPYLVMELVEGETLLQRLQRGALEIPDLVSIGGQIADALDAAHRAGLIHRDVKSSNILITPEGRAKLADFGLAKRLPKGENQDDTVIASLTGGVVGTVTYMSPEQTRGETLDSRTDIFSLGVVLYEAATGRLPFEGPTALSILHEIALVEPPAPSRVRPGMPRAFDHVLSRAMSKNKERRFGTAGELGLALRRVTAQGALVETEPAAEGQPGTGVVPNNLPVAFTSFVGRRDEMEEIARLLGSSRLTTLTGAGGCGKSRLSVQVARNVLESYSQGAWLVELASLTDPALVPQRVASVLGVREEPERPMIEILREALADRTLLLILDNCERLIAPCAELVSAMMAGCPGLRIMATSRERLDVPGEVVWRVSPFPAPSLSQGAPLSFREVSRFESVRLFVERATAVQPTFALTDQNAPTVAQICARLDGIPLAIELAAARVRVLPVAQILARLEDRFRLLTTGTSSALPHQQTLRAAVDWSYELLSETERALFDRFSVFAGGATLEAVETVCSDDGLAEEEILDLLSRLVDKSLLIPQEGVGEAARYRLLETLREYGRERLDRCESSHAVFDRHARFYLSFAETAEPKLKGREQSEWLERVEEEYDNLRRASEWLIESARVEEALRLIGALWRFYRIRGHFGEGRSRLQSVLSLEPNDEGARRARVKALLGAGAIARSLCDFEQSGILLREGLSLGRMTGNREATDGILLELGNVAADEGKHLEARAFFEECLEIRRMAGDKWGMGVALNNLGVISQALNDQDAARKLYADSIALAREHGDRDVEASSLNGLGGIALDHGDYGEAWRHHEDALGVFRRLGDRYGIAFSLREMGRASIGLGNLPKSHELLAESLSIFEALNDRLALAETLEHFAVLAAAEAEDEHALVLAGAAAALHETLGAPMTTQDRERMEQSLAESRGRLGEAAAASAFDGGRAMPLDRVAAIATRARLAK